MWTQNVAPSRLLVSILLCVVGTTWSSCSLFGGNSGEDVIHLSLTVITITEGEDPPVRPYEISFRNVTRQQIRPPRQLGLNDTTSFDVVDHELYDASLSSVPSNCSVASCEDPQSCPLQGPPFVQAIVVRDFHTFTYYVTCVEAVEPIADAGDDQTVDVGSQVTLDGSLSMPDITAWEWLRIYPQSSTWAPPSGSGETFSFTFEEPDSLEYRLTVTNAAGTDTDDVVARSNPPVITSLSSTSGEAGDEITILGNNFSPTANLNAIEFNGVMANVTGSTRTSVAAVVPQGAGTGPVTVEVVATGDVAVGPIFTVKTGPLWERVLSFSGGLLRDVDFVDANTAFVVGVNVIFSSSNGGSTWQQLTDPDIAGADWQAVDFVSPLVGTTVGRGTSPDFSWITRTENGGATWTRQDSPHDRGLVDVQFVSQNEGWAIGDERTANGPGTIIHTVDGGQNWVEQTNPVNGDLTALSFTDALNGTAVGEHLQAPIIVQTSNGGATWSTQSNPGTRELFGVDFIDAMRGIAVGRAGEILTTANGGASWAVQTAQGSNSSTLLLDVQMLSADVVYVVGQGLPTGNVSYLLRSGDFGLSWESGTMVYDDVGSAIAGAVAFSFLNDERGIVINTFDGFLRSLPPLSPIVRR